jgi:hypothetical protein
MSRTLLRRLARLEKRREINPLFFNLDFYDLEADGTLTPRLDLSKRGNQPYWTIRIVFVDPANGRPRTDSRKVLAPEGHD